MSSQIDIESLIAVRPGARRLEGVPRGWYWSDVGFHYVLAVTSDGQRAMQWTTRDAFDAGLARATLALAVKHERAVLEAMPLVVLPGLACGKLAAQRQVIESFTFDVVVGMPPVEGLAISNIAELRNLTYRVFPAYRCEFSGRETKEDCVAKIKKLITPGDPRRKPQPDVRLLYVNTHTKGKISGKPAHPLLRRYLAQRAGQTSGTGQLRRVRELPRPGGTGHL